MPDGTSQDEIIDILDESFASLVTVETSGICVGWLSFGMRMLGIHASLVCQVRALNGFVSGKAQLCL